MSDLSCPTFGKQITKKPGRLNWAAIALPILLALLESGCGPHTTQASTKDIRNDGFQYIVVQQAPDGTVQHAASLVFKDGNELMTKHPEATCLIPTNQLDTVRNKVRDAHELAEFLTVDLKVEPAKRPAAQRITYSLSHRGATDTFCYLTDGSIIRALWWKHHAFLRTYTREYQAPDQFMASAQPEEPSDGTQREPFFFTVFGTLIVACVVAIFVCPPRAKAVALMLCTASAAGCFAFIQFQLGGLVSTIIVLGSFFGLMAITLMMPAWLVLVVYGGFGGALGYVIPYMWEDPDPNHYYIAAAFGAFMYGASCYAFKKAGYIISRGNPGD